MDPGTLQDEAGCRRTGLWDGTDLTLAESAGYGPVRATQEVTMSAPSSVQLRPVTLPRGPVLVGLVYVLCVLMPILIFFGIIVFTDTDPYENDGPVESMIGIGIFGTSALALGLVLAATLSRTEQRAAIGAIVLAVLSVVTLVFFWSGAPGVLGACAAWCAGLTRGARPLTGAARVAGIVGAFVAALNVVLIFGGFALAGAI